MNPYRLQWVTRVRADASLSVGAKSVAENLAFAGVLGRLALGNWRKLNLAEGKAAGDRWALTQIKELQMAGYLGRYQGNKYNQSRGWGLYLPEEESNLFEFSEHAA